MKLNCKPGDLIVVIHPTLHGTQLLGMLATVLHAAPRHASRLPDGFPQQGCPPRYWLLEFPHEIKAPVDYKDGQIRYRSTRYGSAPDHALRPIRDNDGEDETLQWVPRKVTA